MSTEAALPQRAVEHFGLPGHAGLPGALASFALSRVGCLPLRPDRTKGAVEE